MLSPKSSFDHRHIGRGRAWESQRDRRWDLFQKMCILVVGEWQLSIIGAGSGFLPSTDKPRAQLGQARV